MAISTNPGPESRYRFRPKQAVPPAAPALDQRTGAPPVLSALSGPVWEQARAAATVHEHRPGARTGQCLPGAGAFSILLEGSIRVFAASEDGREVTLLRLSPGQVCMLSVAMLRSMGHPTVVAECERPCRLLSIPQRFLHPLMADSAAFRGLLLESMSCSLMQALDKVAETAFQRLDSRLTQHLQQLAGQEQSALVETTHQKLANELGTTREVVSRLLKEQEREGRIGLQRGRISLRDPELLTA